MSARHRRPSLTKPLKPTSVSALTPVMQTSRSAAQSFFRTEPAKRSAAVFIKSDMAKAAEAAGADIVGAEDLADRIKDEGFLDFDVAVAAPNVMGVVGRLGRILGPRGLMPSPKAGTVTPDVAKSR